MKPKQKPKTCEKCSQNDAWYMFNFLIAPEKMRKSRPVCHACFQNVYTGR